MVDRATLIQYIRGDYRTELNSYTTETIHWVTCRHFLRRLSLGVGAHDKLKESLRRRLASFSVDFLHTELT